jgi:hypothetical protein
VATFAKKNIISRDSLGRCNYLMNMRESLYNHQTVDGTDKSAYSAKWVWYLIMRGRIKIKYFIQLP